MATITSLGAGTSLDLETILTSLQTNNDTVLKQISNRQSSYEVKVSSFSQLQSSVQSVLDAATALGKSDTMNAVKSSATGDSVTVTTKAGATPGQYSMVVNSVATAQQLQSSDPVSRTAKHGNGGSIEIELENGQTDRKPRKHVVIVPPGKTVSVVLTADEPGDWPLHCHMLFHMNAGMMTRFIVTPPATATL